jgi:integrase
MPRKRRKRPHGHGTIWEQGGNWWIRWREHGRRHTHKFPNRELAAKVLARIVADIAAGRGAVELDPSGLPTIDEIATDWIERREKAGVVRSWRDDRSHWNAHLKAHFGGCKPPEIDVALIRRFVESKLAEGLAPTSVKHLIVTLSGLFADAIEQGNARANPCRALPRSLRRMLRATHDPKQTPFLERQEDVARMYRALEQPWAAMFALGALGGLRPGEALALEWGDVDLAASRLLVQRQVRSGRVGPPKSGKPRVVPVIPALAKILAEFKLATGDAGKLFPAQNVARGGERGTPGKYLDPSVMSRKLGEALKACELPAMSHYSAGRHTYGALHVLGGGSLATLREILGHSTVQVTERYGHLRPDLFRAVDLIQFEANLSREGGEVIDLSAARDERREQRNEAAAGQTPEAATP